MGYETAEDRENERKALNRLATAWKSDVIQTEPYNPIDGILYKDNIQKAVIEYKNRNIPTIYYYAHISLDLNKWRAGKLCVKRDGGLFLFAVEFIDGSLWWLDCTNLEREVHKNDGRTADPRDDWDIEDCVHLETCLFRRVN